MNSFGSRKFLRRRTAGGPEYCSIMVVDMAGSGRWHNQAQSRARAALTAAMRTAVRCGGIGWADLAVEDRGDGMILLIPPSVSKVEILDPVVPRLAEEIHAHNATVEPSFRIRLRVAVHAGEVHRDASGWFGSDLNTACRLVNGEPLRQALEDSPRTELVLVVSDHIYQGVVRHRYRGIDPAGYSAIRLVDKEFDGLAWLSIPVTGPPAAA